jgi:hypothetical protein
MFDESTILINQLLISGLTLFLMNNFESIIQMMTFIKKYLYNFSIKNFHFHFDS